jgi:protein TonB
MTARQLKVVGKVTLEVVISDTGAVGEVKIVTGNALLTRPAVDAVKKWRFRPFQSEGKPVAVLTTLSFEFDTH